MSAYRTKSRRAFSLVELVVVVLILGIIAAVAAPRMFDTTGDAKKNSTRASLSVIRDSLELYRAQSGSYPSASDLPTALKPFIKGSFPSVQAGTNLNASVVSSSQSPLSTPEAGGAGWVYNETTGEIAVNDAALIAW